MQILDAVNNRAKAVGRNQTPTDAFEFFIDEMLHLMRMIMSTTTPSLTLSSKSPSMMRKYANSSTKMICKQSLNTTPI